MGIFDRLKGRGRGADQQGGGPERNEGGGGTVPAPTPEPPTRDAAGDHRGPRPRAGMGRSAADPARDPDAA